MTSSTIHQYKKIPKCHLNLKYHSVTVENTGSIILSKTISITHFIRDRLNNRTKTNLAIFS